MRSFAFFLLALTYFVPPVHSQDNPSDVHQATSPPVGARFEIIQSELAAKWTFRLDRFTGQVFQFVKTKEGDPAWEETLVIGRSVGSQATRAKYQIFTSGIAARFTFLIDTETGKTWELVTSKEKLPDGTEQENNAWQPFN
jgi:hypothetical protein